MKLPQAILDRIKATVKTVAPDARAYLYGSHARGNARPDSDIDLLILLPDTFTGNEFVKKRSHVSACLYDLSLELGVDISPLITVNKVFHARKTPFTVNIVNEGIEL